MKYKKLYIFLGFTLLATGFYASKSYFQQPNDFSTRDLYHNLYNLYFPDDHSLSLTQRLKRLAYREVVWYKIKNHTDLMGMLAPLNDIKEKLPPEVLSQFDDIIKYGFNKVSAERQDEFRRTLMQTASPDLRKYLFKLRQTWLYIIYSIPLTNEIAGVNPEVDHPIYDVDLKLPESKLRIKGSEIIHTEGEIDYLIVGSGPAGSVIAHELTRNKPGARVVLIESGSFVKPLSTITEFSSDLMESHNDRRTISGGIIVRNGTTVGGGTTVNLDLAFAPTLPQIKAKLALWEKNNCLPASFLHVSGQDWETLMKAYAWVVDKVYTRHVGDGEINRNNRLLKDGDPHSRTYDLNSRKPGTSSRRIAKISATEAFIVPALKGGENFAGHLSLISDAKITNIRIEETNDGKKATEAEFYFKPALDRKYVAKDINEFGDVSGNKMKIKAKNIILCAGTLGSAEILLRSRLSNQNIGKGITIHPSMGVVGMFDREINVLDGLSASVYAPAPDGGYFFEAMSAEPQFLALVHPGSGRDIIHTLEKYKDIGGFGIMLIDSVSNENQVYINPDTDRVEVQYKISDADKKRMKDGLKRAVKILFSQGAREVFIPTGEHIYSTGKFSPFKSPTEADATIERLQLIDGLNFISSAHMQGSNKLGNDPSTSVVSLQFKVWDAERRNEIVNLYVCDSSVFPTSVGANPMQSIYTIAKLFVDRILSSSMVDPM